MILPSAASATELPSEITENTTLTAAGSPYTGSPTIAAGVTVKAEPGARFTLSKLIVKGTLKAEGTVEKPVVFTGKEEKAAGEWTNIKFEPGSGESVLDHVEVSFGGFVLNAAMIEINSSSPTITNSRIQKGKYEGIYVPNGGSPKIADNVFIENGSAFSRAAIKFAATPEKPGEVNIQGNTVKGGGAGISVSNTSTAGSGGNLSGNLIENTSGGGLSYNGVDVPGNITENTLIGNAFNKLEIGGTVAHSSTWNDGGVPISIFPELTVASGVTLKINPGVILMPKKIVVKGTLKAEGSAEDPVVFTGAKEASAGEWQNIKFESGSGESLLDHVEVAYGGSSTNTGMIEVNGSSPTITHSTIRSAKYEGIYVPHGGSPKIADNLFLGNGASFSRAAIKYVATPEEPGAVNIQENLIEGGGAGISVLNTSTGGAGGVLSGNVIIGTSGGGLSYNGVDVPGNITENTLIGNAFNKLEIGGTVAHSSTWNDGGVPISIFPELTVASGVTLKINPGVILMPKKIVVKGTLKAEGTAEDPVVFTGKDQKTAGEWQNIKFESGSGESLLDHVEVAYGGSGTGANMVEVKGSNPSITNSTIRKSSSYGIKVTESGAPQIEWNRFRANANGLSYSGTGNLSAPNNDWGCASGPAPAGCGDAVTSNVKWNPAIQLPELNGHCRGGDSQCGEGADPVILATGQLAYSHRDLLLTNKSRVPLELTRSYSSGSSADTGFGPGWSQSGLVSATELESGDVLILRQDGRQDLFVKTESGYKAPSGVTSTLAKVEGTFQLTTLENTVYRFDASGRIASIADDHGLKTTYGYDANGRLATIADPSSQTLTFSYNASNHITSVKDSTGREVKYGYSGAGDLATVTDALGGVAEYTYDSEHRLKTIKDPRGNVILKNTYDGQGRIIEQKDGLENLWKLEYGEDDTTVAEPEGGKITYGFDGQDRVASEKDQLGDTTMTSYDEAGNVDEVVQPGGAKWQFGYDAKGNLTSVIDPEEGERSYEYDGLNRLIGFADEREETWSYEWSEASDLKKITDPAEGETAATYNASGQPLTVTDPNENTTTFTYDTRGNRLTAKDALEHTTTFGYDSRNYLTSKTAPGLEPETYGRNALGDLLSATTPEGHKTEYAYDANGLLTKVTDPAEGVWKIERNAMERPTAYVDPLGKEAKVEYDGNLNPVKVTDRRGKETTYAFDLANQLEEVVRPEGGDWEFDYDARGNRIEVVDPRENASTYEFDLQNRMTEAAESLEATTSYEYDPASNPISFTDPRENTTELSYDELGRLTEIDQPLEKTTTFTYDGVGNRLTRTTAAGTIELAYDAANRLEEIGEGETALRSFEYDPAGRMIGATDAQADEIEIGYDDDGRVISIDDGRGQTVSRKFDSRGNLTEQTDGRGSLAYEYDKLSRMIELADPQGKILDFDYDQEGNLTKVELPSGVVTTNEFDNAGRLAETTSAQGETTLEALEYEYDPFGNRIAQVDRLSQETSYEYDALNRLIEFDPPGEGSTGYDYDAAGNRTEAGPTTYSFNALNQLTSASNGTTYDYDDAGRLSEVDPGETSTTYDWNALDELTSADTGAEEISYAYDAFGRQVLRNDGSTIRPSHYGDLSDLPILDTDAEGEPTMSYVQGPGGLVEQRAGAATSFPLRDAHGDITTLADDEGEVVSRQTYDPWGGQLSGPSLEMGWLGAQQRRTDPGVGLSQMGVRTYAFDQGSFLSEDPMLGRYGKGQSLNRYAYVQGNPINYFDLDGRITIEIPGTPIELHPMLPTPGNSIPELPVTIDGVPSLPELINNQIPNLPFEDDIQDRANAFIKDKGGELALGCLGGGLGGLGVLNAMSGGAPIFIPGIGWVTELGAAGLGCGIGAAGNSVLGINPIRTR